MTSYLDLAEQALHGSERSKWAACFIAAHEVGNYANGWAIELASRMGYSDVSRVYDLADAGKARKALGMPAKEVYRFRISVYTHAWKVIQAGNDPYTVRAVLREMLQEWHRPKMKDVVDGLNGHFNIPVREYTAKNALRDLDRLTSWYASKGDHAYRKEWDEHTSGLRRILKVSN